MKISLCIHEGNVGSDPHHFGSLFVCFLTPACNQHLYSKCVYIQISISISIYIYIKLLFRELKIKNNISKKNFTQKLAEGQK